MVRPDPSLLRGVVAREVLEAMEIASAALKQVGVRHVVVGGLAVGANGFPRATRDVDFLVGDEAFERHEGGLVTLRQGVPVEVNRVAVDFIGADANESFLAAALEAEAGSIIEGPPLVYMKLKSPRHKDRTDVIELVKAGLDVDRCREFLGQRAPARLRVRRRGPASAGRGRVGSPSIRTWPQRMADWLGDSGLPGNSSLRAGAVRLGRSFVVPERQAHRDPRWGKVGGKRLQLTAQEGIAGGPIKRRDVRRGQHMDVRDGSVAVHDELEVDLAVGPGIGSLRDDPVLMDLAVEVGEPNPEVGSLRVEAGHP